MGTSSDLEMNDPIHVYQAGGLMKFARNQPCPCGSGLKFKKCCLNRGDLADLPLERTGRAIPASIIDDVVDSTFSLPNDDLVRRLDALANTQPALCGLITSLSSSLPQSACVSAALRGRARISSHF